MAVLPENDPDISASMSLSLSLDTMCGWCHITVESPLIKSFNDSRPAHIKQGHWQLSLSSY